MSYEYEVRKRAFYFVREEGQTLEQAIDSAIADQEVRALRFINPLSLIASTKRHHADAAGDHEQRWRQKSRKGDKGGKGTKGEKGKGKGEKGKGKGSKGEGGKTQTPENYASRTPDGRLICFKYNRADDSCNGKCNMLHVCQVKGCHDKHPAHSCPKITK